MNNPQNNLTAKPAGFEAFQLLYFSRLLNRRICLDKTNRKNGRLTDLVFRLSEPYPEAVGIYIEHGKGHPTELIPWEKVRGLRTKPFSSRRPKPASRIRRSWTRKAGFCSTNT